MLAMPSRHDVHRLHVSTDTHTDVPYDAAPGEKRAKPRLCFPRGNALAEVGKTRETFQGNKGDTSPCSWCLLMASLSTPPGKGTRSGEDDGVQLEELPPGLLVPTPMSPSGLSEVGTKEGELGGEGAAGIFPHALPPARGPVQTRAGGARNSGGSARHPEPIAGSSGQAVGQERRREGALHHFRGRNVLCLNGRCVLGRFDVV